jgi:acyl carrier protein
MDFKNQIRTFICNNFFLSNSSNGLKDEQSFLETGIIDSTGVLELVAFIEETFKITINDDELIPQNLDSIENLNRFIQKKKELQAIE